MPMGQSMMPSMNTSQPAYNMPYMVLAPDAMQGNVPHESLEKVNADPTSPSSATSMTTIALEKALPDQGEWGADMQQMYQAAAPWPSTGVVQYALVPVAMMPHDMAEYQAEMTHQINQPGYVQS